MAEVEAESSPEDQPADEGEEADEALEGEADEEEPEGEEEEQESSASSEEDPFELLNESDSDDEEEQAAYKEYLEVVKEIDAQNLVIRELKAKATELRCKRCKTYRDKDEYKRLRICQEQQDIRLRQLVNRAAQLQNFGSRRLYGEVEIELSEAEQSCFFTGLASSSSFAACPCSPREEECCNKGLCWESDSDSDSDAYDPLCWTEF